MGNKKAKKHKQDRTEALARRQAAMSAREPSNSRARLTKVAAAHDLVFQSPHVPAFFLLTAKAFRDRAEPKRIEALTRTRRKRDGKLRPLDPAAVSEALEGLALAVILSAAAVEAHANDMIGRLPWDATVEVQRKTIRISYERDAMEQSLNLVEKITLVGPMLTGRDSIKGTEAWEAYWRVVQLRNELLHVDPDGGSNGDRPGPFGLLLRGDGSRAPEDAAVAIHAVEPDWIPEHVRRELGIAE